MSHIWTFSPTSEPYLQRCIDAALLQENNNKWIEKFGRSSNNNNIIFEIQSAEAAPDEANNTSSPEEQQKIDITVTYEDFFDSMENEIRLDIIAAECSKNPDLMMIMSQRLSANAVEKLFKQIFTSTDLEISFLTDMFTKFLLAYIKHQYSWFCIDLLVKINGMYPELFQKLLKKILEDIEIQNNVLKNYISTFSEEKLTDFMEQLTNIELSSESFINNILTIYLAYKDCKKTDRIQKYIISNLMQHSIICSLDRNYGRLFLMYIQAEKALEHNVNVNQLEECLEIHRSPFKRPCLNLLKEFENYLYYL